MLGTLLLLSLDAVAADPPPPDLYADPKKPGINRVALATAGTAGVAAGVVWFFSAGDQLGSGDPAAYLAAVGLVGTVGAIAGGGVRGLIRDESDLFGEASTPVISTSFGPGGAPWARERNASTVSLDLRPRIDLGRLRITPGATLRTTLGETRDADWRPQGDYSTALTHSARGIDLDLEFRTRLTYAVDVIAQPILWQRWETLGLVDRERRLRRTLFVPVALGFRWRLSGRQYFESTVGPRFDTLTWPGDDAGSLGPVYAPLWITARYRIQVAHPEVFGGLLRSRIGFGYSHVNFDGQGYNFGAVVGFAGPFTFDWDVRWTPNRGPAWQAGLDLIYADGGGIGFTLGIAPRESAP